MMTKFSKKKSVDWIVIREVCLILEFLIKTDLKFNVKSVINLFLFLLIKHQGTQDSEWYHYPINNQVSSRRPNFKINLPNPTKPRNSQLIFNSKPQPFHPRKRQFIEQLSKKQKKTGATK